ncbi:hypothetical protein AHAS_Ahas11G0158000 [Arachis hypogaea]
MDSILEVENIGECQNGPLHALGCAGSVEGEEPNGRRGYRIGGDGEGSLSTQAVHVEGDGVGRLGAQEKRLWRRGADCQKFGGGAEWVQGVNGVDVGLNDELCNDDASEHSGGAQQIDITRRGIETSCHRIMPEINKRDGYGDDEGSMEGRTCANDDDASNDESLRLNEQLLENKRTWELAKESRAELYNEEDDIIAILQQ